HDQDKLICFERIVHDPCSEPFYRLTEGELHAGPGSISRSVEHTAKQDRSLSRSTFKDTRNVLKVGKTDECLDEPVPVGAEVDGRIVVRVHDEGTHTNRSGKEGGGL